MDSMPGIIGDIGRCNAKDIPVPDTSHTQQEVTRSLVTLLNTIHSISNTNRGTEPKTTQPNNTATHTHLADACKQTTTLTDDAIRELESNIQQACTSTADTTPYFANINDIMRVKRLTKDKIIIPMDKADSSLAVM